MAKELLTEAKISKFLSFIMGAIIGGKTDNITSKVSDDRELVKRIKDADKSYKEMEAYVKKKYGKDFMKDVETKANRYLRAQGFDL